METKKIIRKLVLFSCLIVILLVSCTSKTDTRQVSEARAQKIIDSLYAYELSFGTFPDQLDVLVPEYMDRIPTTARDEQFLYSVNQSVGFYLSFEIDSHRGCTYTDKYKIWDCDYYGGE